MTGRSRSGSGAAVTLLTIFAIAGTLCACGVYGAPVRSAAATQAGANAKAPAEPVAAAAGPASEDAAEANTRDEGWVAKKMSGSGSEGVPVETNAEPNENDAAGDAETWSDEP
jgi:hypothetical protein